MRSLGLLGAAIIALTAGCGRSDDAPAPRPTARTDAPAVRPTVPPLPTDAWIGRWVGVEGLALDIAPTATRGRYALKEALLDGASTYEGTADGETITFERNEETQTIRKATGAETGLKWLATKKDCLMVEEGEGFCRD